jgi:hypothetical protein
MTTAIPERFIMSYSKKFDAIYTAKIEPFKRLQLASNVIKLAIAAHPFGYSESYGAQIKKLLSEATWLTN